MARPKMDTAVRNEFELLLDVGIALSSTRDLDRLLRLILSEARRFTTADAATLYLVQDGRLRARIGECQTFITRWGAEKAQQVFQSFTLPISMDSIAGAAAHTRQVVVVEDVQNPKKSGGFRYNPEYDRKNDYLTRSVLAVPMMDAEGTVIGVLQLINAQESSLIVPFDKDRVKLARALASQAGVSIRNAILTQNLRQSHLDTLRRLGLAAEWRDKETANHITRVSLYCRTVAEALELPPERVDLLELASPMHDVGKLGIPDAILHKPGRLTDEERIVMQAHAIIGANIMANANNDEMRMSCEVALGHHERWDGKGYPRGLSGEEIPLSCRIVAIADVYDALSSRRCYKPALPHEEVMAILDQENGRHFDPAVVEAFKSQLPQIIRIRDEHADTEQDFLKFRDYAGLELQEEQPQTPEPA